MTERKATPNRKNIHAVLGSSSFTTGDRHTEDYYATPPEAVKALLEKETFSKNIIEPSIGGGSVAKVLKDAGHDVIGYDIIDRGYPNTIVQDFLTVTDVFKNTDIIGNPPYKDALKHVEHCLDVIEPGQKVAMFLKIQFLEGKARRKFFDKNPPRRIYVASSRYACAINGDFTSVKGSAVCYAWYVWEKGYTGLPQLDWIN